MRPSHLSRLEHLLPAARRPAEMAVGGLGRAHPGDPAAREGGRVAGGEALPALAVDGDGVRDGLGRGLEGLLGEVGHVVGGGVVVGVVQRADRAAEHRGLLLRLRAVGARVEAAAGHAVVEEGPIVAAAVELGGDEGDVLRLVVVLEQLLGLGGAGGAGQVEGVPVAVVDPEDVVRRGDHVEVEIQPDLLELGSRRDVRVVLRPEQPLLLGRPPGESDLVLDPKFGKGPVINPC